MSFWEIVIAALIVTLILVFAAIGLALFLIKMAGAKQEAVEASVGEAEWPEEMISLPLSEYRYLRNVATAANQYLEHRGAQSQAIGADWRRLAEIEPEKIAKLAEAVGRQQ